MTYVTRIQSMRVFLSRRSRLILLLRDPLERRLEWANRFAKRLERVLRAR